MNKEERSRHITEVMEGARGTFKPVLEDQYKIWLENQPEKENEKDLSKMSRKHRIRLERKGALKHIK